MERIAALTSPSTVTLVNIVMNNLYIDVANAVEAALDPSRHTGPFFSPAFCRICTTEVRWHGCACRAATSNAR